MPIIKQKLFSNVVSFSIFFLIYITYKILYLNESKKSFPKGIKDNNLFQEKKLTWCFKLIELKITE